MARNAELRLSCLQEAISLPSILETSFFPLPTCSAAQEYEVVWTAIDNADRYYRVMATGVQSKAADAERASAAFKAVAGVFLQNRAEVSRAAALVTFLDVMLLGGTW